MTKSGKFAQWVSNTLRDKGTVELWRDEVRSFVAVRQVRDGVKAAILKYGVSHEPADDHEARALEAAAVSPSETARFHHRARALRPAVFLHLNLGGPMALSRVQFGRAVASAASLDADLVRGALRPAGTARKWSRWTRRASWRRSACLWCPWIWPCGRAFSST